MKLFALLSMASLAAFSLGQGDSGSVTCTRTEPVGRLLAEIGRQTNQTLEASANVRDDVVALDCKDAPSADVMAKIASVLHAQWVKAGSSLVLSRDPNLVSADERAEKATKVAIARKKIAALVQKVKGFGEFDAALAKKVADDQNPIVVNDHGSIDAKRFQSAAERSPGTRAMIALLSRMSDGELGALISGKRVVFSNRPTRMQLPLPGNWSDVTLQFIRNQRSVVAATPPPADPNTRVFVFNGSSDSRMGAGNPNNITTAMVVANPAFFSNTSVQLDLTIADGQGATICSGGMNLDMTEDSMDEKAPIEKQKPIGLSDLSKAYDQALLAASGGAGGSVRMMAISIASDGGVSGAAAAPAAVTFSTDSGNSQKVKLTPELLEIFKHPESREPLGFSAAEGFQAVAQAHGKFLCAYLPDNLVMPVARFFARSDTAPTAFEKFAKNNLRLSIADDGQWTTVQPVYQYSARNQRVARGPLGQLLRSMLANNAIRLDDMSSYSLAQKKSPSQRDFDLAYALVLNSAVASETLIPQSSPGSWEFVRLYGSLSGGQRSAMLNRQSVPVRTFNSTQMDILNDAIFQSMEGPSNVGGPGAPSAPGMRFMIGGEDVTRERTFVLGNGIPANAFVQMSSSTQPSLQTTDANGNVRNSSVGQVAMDRYQSEHPEFASRFGNMERPTVTGYRPATQVNYQLRIMLAPNYGRQQTLQDTALGIGVFGQLDALPANTKKQITDQLDVLRKSMARGFGNGGGAVPPPLPL